MKNLINKLRGLGNNKKLVITLAATFTVIVVMIIALVVIKNRVNDLDRMQSVDVAGITEESTEIVNATSTEIATTAISTTETAIVNTDVVLETTSNTTSNTTNGSQGSASVSSGGSSNDGESNVGSSDTPDTEVSPNALQTSNSPNLETILNSIVVKNLLTGETYTGSQLYNMTFAWQVADYGIGTMMGGLRVVANPYNALWSSQSSSLENVDYDINGYSFNIMFNYTDLDTIHVDAPSNVMYIEQVAPYLVQ